MHDKYKEKENKIWSKMKLINKNHNGCMIKEQTHYLNSHDLWFLTFN